MITDLGLLGIMRTLQAPPFLAVVGIAAIMTLLLYTEHPRVSQRTVLALVPWMIVGSALWVITSATRYPPVIREAISGPGAYLTTWVVVCLIWFLYLQFARNSRLANTLPIHLGAIGLGTAGVLVVAAFVMAGGLTIGQIFWLTVSPVLSAAVAVVILIVIGLWYPETPAYTGVAGGLAIFGHVLAAMGTGVSVVTESGHTVLSRAIMNVVHAIEVARMTGLGQELIWAWGLVWFRLAVATVAVVALTTYTHRHPSRGNLALGLIAAIGIVGGVSVLLSIMVGP